MRTLVIIALMAGGSAFAQDSTETKLNLDAGLMSGGVLNACQEDQLTCKQTCWDEDPALQSLKMISSIPRPSAANLSELTTETGCYTSCDDTYDVCRFDSTGFVETSDFAEVEVSEEQRLVCQDERSSCERQCDENDPSTQAMNQILDARGADRDTRNSTRRIFNRCNDACRDDYDDCLRE